MLESYLLFLLKFLTLIVVFFVCFGGIVVLSFKAKQKNNKAQGQLTVAKVSDRLDKYEVALNKVLMSETNYQEWELEKKKSKKNKTRSLKHKLLSFFKEAKTPDIKEGENSEKKRLFIIDFVGDVQASSVETLKEEVTAILLIAKENDRVLIRLESSGGLVHQYGFAANQMMRLREAGLYCIASIDRVAASGGYLMACVAHEIISAPFAVIGSIGVIAQLPNVNKLLGRYDIDIEEHTAGEYKRTLTVFGQNTDSDREKFIDDLQVVHQLFKDFVTNYRPQLVIEEVATGEVWYGQQAIDHRLIDKIQVSDTYLLESLKEWDTFEVKYSLPERFIDRLFMQIKASAKTSFMDILALKDKKFFM